VKTNTVDHPEAIADRFERVGDAVDDGTPLVAPPDCGFGTQAGLGTVDPEMAWANSKPSSRAPRSRASGSTERTARAAGSDRPPKTRAP
jgi:hypothetical protein